MARFKDRIDFLTLGFLLILLVASMIMGVVCRH